MKLGDADEPKIGLTFLQEDDCFAYYRQPDDVDPPLLWAIERHPDGCREHELWHNRGAGGEVDWYRMDSTHKHCLPAEAGEPAAVAGTTKAPCRLRIAQQTNRTSISTGDRRQASPAPRSRHRVAAARLVETPGIEPAGLDHRITVPVKASRQRHMLETRLVRSPSMHPAERLAMSDRVGLDAGR